MNIENKENRETSNNSSVKVSVILPVHNGEKYIRESIDSVLEQTFRDLELIVLNDACTDSTKGILDEYFSKDSRIKVLNLKKQESLADVLNIGINESKGKYIARMDHDDVMYKNRLLDQYNFMESNPNVVVCGGQVDMIDEDGEKIGERSYPLDSESLKRNLFLISPFAHPSVIMRKDSLLKVGGYEKGLKKVEDIMLWFRLTNEGDFANVNSKVLKYRVRGDSESLGDTFMHFRRTYNLRKRVIKENIYPIDFRQRVLLEIQNIVVLFMKILPYNWFMKVFEIGRKALLK